jgi:hypothetical protein
MAVFGLLATAFVVGLGNAGPRRRGGRGPGGVFLVPLAVLVGVALAWPRVGTWVLGVATLGVVGFIAVRAGLRVVA